MVFYDRFNELCKAIKKTTTGVGEELGIGRSTVNNWRYGGDIKATTLQKIADYFNVSVDYLLGKTDIKNPPDKRSPEEIAKFALFNGDTDIPESVWQIVQSVARTTYEQYKESDKNV